MILLLLLLGCRREKEEAAPTDTWGDSGEPWVTDWTTPDCDSSGTAAITWTSDQGSSAAEREGEVGDNAFTESLIVLETAGALAASYDGALLRSDDAGCTWRTIAVPDGSQRTLLAAGDRVYAWSSLEETIYRLDGDTLTELAGPPATLVGLGVDPQDPDTLRAGSDGCDIYASTDGGTSWSLSQAAPSSSLNATSVAFDPEDLDHVVCTMTEDGAFTSFNGGERWDRARGFLTEEAVNMFAALIVPGDRSVVWAQGLRVADTKRLLWRSDDGGVTWMLGVEEGDEVALGNTVPLAVHPSAPNVVAFAGGATLYTYDARTDTLTAETPVGETEIQALVASPASAGLWYLGLGDARSEP